MLRTSRTSFLFKFLPKSMNELFILCSFRDFHLPVYHDELNEVLKKIFSKVERSAKVVNGHTDLDC